MKRRLSRRTFLRGAAGAALGLPFLEAMIPRGTSGAAYASEFEIPRRQLYYFVPNGMHMPAWTPTETGSDYRMPLILGPMEEHREDMLVLSNMSNRAGIDSIAGDHARGTAAFLTARRAHYSESDLDLGVSVDQLAAEALQGTTPYRSLQFGMESGGTAGACDSGYSCAYSNNISWADANTPLPKMISPYVIFERLFGGDEGLNPVEALRRQSQRASILDLVQEDAQRLQSELGADDRDKLDEYLTAVREVETRMQAGATGEGCDLIDIRPGILDDTDGYARIMNELMVMALRCDMTRVVSFMLGNGGSNRFYAFLEVYRLHHEISHHQNREENYRMLETIGRWEMEIFADLLSRMKAVEEPDGSNLLDNSLVYFGSEIGDGNRHNHTDMPTLLCGRGGGAVSPGRHVAYDEEQPTARLFVSMLQNAGVETETFGMDGDGPIEGLAE